MVVGGKACDSKRRTHPLRSDKYGPKCAADCTKMCVTANGRPASVSHYAETPCPNCDRALWPEVRTSGAFRFVVYFEDEESSGTYAEHITRCPGCSIRLDGNALKLHGLPWRQ